MTERSHPRNVTTSTRHPIRAVARLTGLGIDTIRAWERRYGAIVPARDGRGRVYTDADVRRLQLLGDAVARGHSIGRIANLDDEDLAAIGSSTRALREGATARRAAPQLAPLLRAVEQLDGTRLEADLSRSAALLPPREWLEDVVAPLMREVGDRWHAGSATVAQEHMLSAIVRSLLGSLLRSHAVANTTRHLVFATPSGEFHELGTLGAALLSASGGLGTLYLGANLPAAEIAGVTAAVATDAVVLGVTAQHPSDPPDAEVAAIATHLPPRVELWLGGPSASRVAARLHGRARVILSYQDLVVQLERLGARF